jgi:hypothetical protein
MAKRYHVSPACRRGFKVGDKVTIRGGWFTGKAWKRGTPGVIKKWSGCGVAEVAANVPGYGRDARFDIGVSDLTRRK